MLYEHKFPRAREEESDSKIERLFNRVEELCEQVSRTDSQSSCRRRKRRSKIFCTAILEQSKFVVLFLTCIMSSVDYKSSCPNTAGTVASEVGLSLCYKPIIQ